MNRIVANWYRQGRPVTSIGVPHEVKAHVLESWADKFALKTFVETGTCHGAMVMALLPRFDRIHTVEMYEPNYNIAKDKLGAHAKVTCYFGDSAEVLESIVAELDEPALFFLDAHYSGPGTARGSIDTPIVRELEILAASPYPNVVVIDDARLFAGEAHHSEEFADYPSFEWIASFVKEHFTHDEILVRDADEFVIVPDGGEV